MIIFELLEALLLVISIAFLLDLKPSRITSDLLAILTPKSTVRQDAIAIRKGQKTAKSYRYLMNLRDALTIMGKEKNFAIFLTLSLVLFAVGVFLSIVIDNLFLLPILAVVGGLLPFLYASNLIATYKQHILAQLESTLSTITVAYCRTDNIIAAVRDNEQYITPPLREIFSGFVSEATSVDSNIKRSLLHLREKIDNDIYTEWVDTLIRCQEDRTLKDTLIPIVEKFTDVRIVNEELKTMLGEIKTEYWTMVILLVSIIPIVYMINKDWYHTLIYTVPGKIMLAICASAVLVTYLLMRRWTKPIEYKR